jgi:hypothetical protein
MIDNFLEMSLLDPQKVLWRCFENEYLSIRGECFCMEEEERLFYEYMIERVSVLYIEKSL